MRSGLLEQGNMKQTKALEEIAPSSTYAGSRQYLFDLLVRSSIEVARLSSFALDSQRSISVRLGH